MKKLVVAVSCFMLSASVFAQARDGTEDFKKNAPGEPVALINLPYSVKVVEQALNNFLLKTTSKDQRNAPDFLLSANTTLAKNNTQDADMVFVIRSMGDAHVNESVVYLKLISSVPVGYGDGTSKIYFDQQHAIDYLDNLAIAMRPYATQLQLRFQNQNLSKAIARSTQLENQGNKLERKRTALAQETGPNTITNTPGKPNKKQNDNQKKIDENTIAQTNQARVVSNQRLSLALLTAQSKNQ